METLVSIVIPTQNRIERLERLLSSVYKSTYKNFEVIIVHDKPGKLNIDQSLYPRLTLIENGLVTGLSNSRNVGATASKGKYVLFIDDDNVIDDAMISHLTQTMDADAHIAAAGPITFHLSDKERVWFLSCTPNHATSRFHFFYEPADAKRFAKRTNWVQTDNLHNCFMVRRGLGEDVGWFDKKIFVSGTEYDLFARIQKKRPTEAVLVTDLNAKSYHDIPVISPGSLRGLGFSSGDLNRVYYMQRNRGVLTGRYGTLKQRFIMGLFGYPFFFSAYLGIFVYHSFFTAIPAHIRGTVSGYRYLIFPL